MKIFITGNQGMLGSVLMEQLSGWADVAGCDITTGGNILDNTFYKYLRFYKPDMIIHTAAFIDVDWCEENHDPTYKLNHQATADLAFYCSQHNIKLVYISTHAVFDGQEGGYNERSQPNPVNVYAYSKLLGEVAVTLSGCQHLILRVNIIGDRGFFQWLVDELQKPDPEFYDDILCSYTSCKDVAGVIHALKNETGLFHVGHGEMSKAGLAHIVADEMGVDPRKIRNVHYEQKGALRPKNITVNDSKLKQFYTTSTIYEVVRELCSL